MYNFLRQVNVLLRDEFSLARERVTLEVVTSNLSYR